MKTLLSLLTCCILVACHTTTESQMGKNIESEQPNLPVIMQDDLPILKQNSTLKEAEYKPFFDSCGITDACFVLHNLQHNAYTYYNSAAANIPYSPASTFKIFNSLVALETKAIEDTNTLIKWDGVWRSRAEWNRDQCMKTAFQYSAVWFYQEMARRAGEKSMKSFLEKAHYGNGNMKGGLDQFWLTGELKISPIEQISFLEKLYKEQNLPFSIETQRKVKGIMIEEQNEKGVLRAKTGWGISENGKELENVGWYVGYVEKANNQYFFALCIHYKGETRDDFVSCRKKITRQILKKLEIW